MCTHGNGMGQPLGTFNLARQCAINLARLCAVVLQVLIAIYTPTTAAELFSLCQSMIPSDFLSFANGVGVRR